MTSGWVSARGMRIPVPVTLPATACSGAETAACAANASTLGAPIAPP